MRQCGGCDVCCFVGGVPELPKEPHARCPHQGGGCGIHASENRPKVCGAFQCAWLRGIGPDDARPDKVGVMFSINRTERGNIGFAVETAPDALRTTARAMAVAFVNEANLPLVVTSYGNAPPHDTGDKVVLRKEHVIRAASMRGKLIEELGPGVSLYELARREV